MDISKEYIEMCEKAIEVQDLKPDCVLNSFRCGWEPRVYYGDGNN